MSHIFQNQPAKKREESSSSEDENFEANLFSPPYEYYPNFTSRNYKPIKKHVFMVAYQSS